MIIMAIYFVNSLSILTGESKRNKFFDLFEVSVFLQGTVAHFLALLILSSRHSWDYNRIDMTYLLVNVWAVFSGLVGFLLGTAFPELAILKGLAVTYFIVYVQVKLCDIKWEDYWSFGMLGGSLIVYGACIYVKSNAELFV